MTTQPTRPTIRSFPDGSIDFAHYEALGRQLRSQQAHRLTRRTASKLPTVTIVVVTVLAAVLILPMAA